DAALAAHEPRDRVLCANSTRDGKREYRTREIVGRALIATGLCYEVLIFGDILRKTHGVCTFDARHKERASPVGFRDINRDTQVDVGWCDNRRLTVNFLVVNVLAGELLDGLHKCPTD